MGLTQALAASLSGLQATQTGLSIVAGNVANAQTPGYVAQTVSQAAVGVGDTGESVRVTAVNRTLDSFVQQQLRTETSGGAYADLNASFYQQLQQVYGQPGSNTTLDSVFNSFTSAVQALSTSPSSGAAQAQTISAAQSLASELNSATASIQSMRSQADQGIANDVNAANNALQQIANINQQLQGMTTNDSTKASLEDQRDQFVDQLSKLVDIRVATTGNDQVTVFTTSGTQLVGTVAGVLQFNQTGNITANQQWNSNPALSGLGTISLTLPGGSSVDLLANGSLRSGEIAGYVNMRDNVLVQAQSQIDAIASQMSSALSDTTSAGSAVSVGTKNGFTTDVGGMLAGNTTQVVYTDSSNVQHTVNIVRVDDPSVLPLSNSVTSNPNDTVVGVDFSGGMASVVTQLNAALSSTGLQFTNPSGTSLNVLDSGPGTITVNSVATTTTATTLNGGSGALPLFTDGTAPYSGAITAAGAQSVGYAGRIQVNAALIGDPSKLVSYQTGTAAGDATRPNFIYSQLSNTSLQFSPTTGIGGATAPFQGTLPAFISQMVSQQSLAATAANNLQSGQDVVVNSLQAKFSATSGVNIDTEMANLLTLQNNYGANARVMSTVKQMLDALLQM
jgi:flagellar hook-associated protein 1 FlgK